MRKLIDSSQAIKAKRQHTSPCSDCPVRRNALPGWLGDSNPREYAQLLHSDHAVPCHVIDKQQCAGVAIYRTNVCKRADFRLPRDTVTVFSTPMEFVAHHENLGG